MRLFRAKQISRKSKIFVVLCVIVVSQIVFFNETITNYLFPKMISIRNWEELELNVSTYLVKNSKCQIPNLTAFNSQALPFYKEEEYIPCSKVDLLTYITKTGDIATLRINKDVISSYTVFEPHCCFSIITRGFSEDTPDNILDVGTCVRFQDSVELPQDTEIIKVQCRDSFFGKFYENVHAIVTMKRKVRMKLRETRAESFNGAFNVILVGIDGVSRLNFLRTMPRTHKYLRKNEWVPLEGYNKVADNTFPNLMSILTGMNETEMFLRCDPYQLNKLDNCSILWYDYQKLGYITAYAEDETWMSTFNYGKKGFTRTPTDYYFRPYMMAAERLLPVWKKNKMTYCTGVETSGERILNVARDFTGTFRNRPIFGFFWMNTFSHDYLNGPQRMDRKIADFLEDPEVQKAIVFFFSDHGIRYGAIRATPTGWLEERTPFFYIHVPQKFRERFPQEYSNLLGARNKLTNPFDFYMTLEHILVLSRSNFIPRPAQGCPKCKSLFTDIDQERACEDVGIEHHWCACLQDARTSNSSTRNYPQKVVDQLANYVVQQITNITAARNVHNKCAKFALGSIVSFRTSRHPENSALDYFLVVLETKPKASFEATVLYNVKTGRKTLQSSISRIDKYDKHSYCVDDPYLKKYCYCGLGL